MFKLDPYTVLGRFGGIIQIFQESRVNACFRKTIIHVEWNEMIRISSKRSSTRILSNVETTMLRMLLSSVYFCWIILNNRKTFVWKLIRSRYPNDTNSSFKKGQSLSRKLPKLHFLVSSSGIAKFSFYNPLSLDVASRTWCNQRDFFILYFSTALKISSG